MTETREYRTIDKTGWGDGPWQAEPDKRQWADKATGLPCLIVRGPMGALCGYVGVSKDHPGHGMDYDALSNKLLPDGEYIDVHGGLTFADGCGHGADESKGICHIPAPGEPDDVWWFGFDCAHPGDMMPDRGRISLVDLGDVYRDAAYVTAECAALAKQLTALAS